MKNALALLETLEQESLGTHPQLRAVLAGVMAAAVGSALLLGRSQWPTLVLNDLPTGHLDPGIIGGVICIGIALLLLPAGLASWIMRSRLRPEARFVRVAVGEESAPLALRETGPFPVVPTAYMAHSGAIVPAPARAGRTGPLATAPQRAVRTGILVAEAARGGQTGPLSPPPPPAPGARLKRLKRLAAVQAKESAVSTGITLFAVLGPAIFVYVLIGGDLRLVESVLFGFAGVAVFIALRANWRLRSFSVVVDDQGFRWRPGGLARSARVAWPEVRAICRTTLNVSEDGSRQSIYVIDTPAGVLIWSIARPPRTAGANGAGARAEGIRSSRSRRPRGALPPPPTPSATSGERLLRYALACTGLPLRDLSKLIGAPAKPVPHHFRPR